MEIQTEDLSLILPSITNKNISKINSDQPIWVIENLFDYVLFVCFSWMYWTVTSSSSKYCCFFYIDDIKSIINS